MKIDMNAGEIWNLLEQGSTNQKNFINCLDYTEFEQFIEYLEFMEDFDEFDLRGYLNGGVIEVVESPEDAEEVEGWIIWENERIMIVLV